MLRRLALLCLIISVSFGANAKLRVAVASNFHPTLKNLTEQFSQQTGIAMSLSSASSGTLFAQIIKGAPFDVFLSADASRPQQLESRGLIIADSRSTYAFGQLVLWVPGANSPTLEMMLDLPGRIAIANPRVAPYGIAAQQVLNSVGLWSALQDKLVRGNNVTQAYQFVRSGNASAGLVALSQIESVTDDVILIPAGHYQPIAQQMVILGRTQDLDAAREFTQFLLSEPVQGRLVEFGYVSGTGDVQ